jgi:cytochrome P450
LELLRGEIGDPSRLNYTMLQNLPILDSFIKETVRMNPLDTLAIRRKALKPFSFSNGGPQAVPGNIACVSSFDLMHDETSYPNAYRFDGLRFVPTKKDTTMRGTKLTDVSEKFPVWGFGSLACPGRFHASLVMKMVLVHLISNYDIRFEDPKARRQFRWETFTMPYESTRILIRPRAC